MKILHLFSNSKWTGPAEPALRLCLSLCARGLDVDFACAPGPVTSLNKIAETARDNGIEPILDLRLSKHRNPLYNWQDRRALAALLRERKYDIVHCHLDNDNRIALPVARRLGVPVVRSSYEGTGFADVKLHRPLVRGLACLIESSRMAYDHDRRAYNLPEERMAVVPPAIDLERFDPAREVPDGRRWLGISPNAFVVGIVARMQTHRFYGVFFEAVARLAADGLPVHAVVVGRGTKQEQVAHEPVRRLNLTERVHFAGFIEGENYVGMVKAFDVKVFLKPGTDGTCRAAREAMAMGKPAVVADRGMLPEIVDHDRTGLVFDGSADGLYAALRPLVAEPARARVMGRAARQHALETWSPEKQAGEVERIYRTLLSR